MGKAQSRKAIFLGFVLSLLCSCATPRPRGTVVELKGTVNPLRMNAHTCWILETGTMKDKAFYELHGPEHLLQRIRRENLYVHLRALLLPDCTPACGIGICIEVTNIVAIGP